MNSVAGFRNSAADVAAMVSRELARLRSLEGDHARRTESTAKKVASLRAELRIQKAASHELRSVPLLGRFLSRGRQETIRKIAGELAVDKKLLDVTRSAGRKIREERTRLENLEAEILEVRKRAGELAQPSSMIEGRAETAGNRLTFLRSRPRLRRDDLIAVAEEFVTIGKDWIADSGVARQTAASVRQRGLIAPVKERIYLPIPVSMRHAAQRAGAIYDPAAGTGSRMFVPLGADLSRLERMLPLGYRKNPPKLSFPPIRPGAAGHAIWGVFDKETWDYVRASAYDRTGRRCMLCGKRSGKMRSQIFPDIGKRIGDVECHEVWDWKVPDPQSGVGIQRLKGLLVVCFECHTMFHESFFVEAAKRVGIDRQVAEHIEQRRMLVTRTSREDLARAVELASLRWQSQSGIQEWVLDLSHLASQDFMSHQTPVLHEWNEANVPPGMVAGIAFTTDRGREFPARDVHEVYADALARMSIEQGFVPTP